MAITTLSEQVCFDGTQGFYTHSAATVGTDMRFAVFMPPQAKDKSVPVVYYLAGLTCTEETATTKAGAQRLASDLGLALVMPDTSPRGARIDGEDEDWDFGTGAGFYVDATNSPWCANYQMYSYVTDELRTLVEQNFSVDSSRVGIFGHSMGGHGALTIGLKNPTVYTSVSAFAPISAPIQCPWGQKALRNYLGEDQTIWRSYDACALIEDGHRTTELLVDQGSCDQFLQEQLHPHLLQAACDAAGQPLRLRMHEGYDHSYYFIQSVMADHLKHHANLLRP